MIDYDTIQRLLNKLDHATPFFDPRLQECADSLRALVRIAHAAAAFALIGREITEGEAAFRRSQIEQGFDDLMRSNAKYLEGTEPSA